MPHTRYKCKSPAELWKAKNQKHFPEYFSSRPILVNFHHPSLVRFLYFNCLMNGVSMTTGDECDDLNYSHWCWLMISLFLPLFQSYRVPSYKKCLILIIDQLFVCKSMFAFTIKRFVSSFWASNRSILTSWHCLIMWHIEVPCWEFFLWNIL